MSYKKVDPKQDFPKLEEEILKFWQDNKIFEKSLEKNKGKERFAFFEGPPTANGRPGIHHVEARSFKDIIPRFKTMKGYYVSRRAGWDTHGLPVEIQVEKELGISGKKQIEDYGIEKFNQKCKESVWLYKADWEKLTERIGYWIDLKNAYITYDNSYIEKVWGILKKIYEKDLLYQGFKVVPYCPRCGTPLSSHEVAQGYRKVSENSVYIKFKIKDEKDTYILSWTTTPWTLPGNVALAIGEDIDYVKIKKENETWILAKDRLNAINESQAEVLENLKGKDLAGLEYEPLFKVEALRSEKSYRIYPADFVTTSDGTGVVHTAVMYGEDDYNLGKKVGLPTVHTVDEAGKFNDLVPELAGLAVKENGTEEKIIDHLRKTNSLVKTELYSHEYPFCWRCDSPLIYYAKTSWFIAMSKVKDQLVKNNKGINWVPAYIKNGRFGEWLAEVKDWALSRERYWGTPLPIWECACGEKIIIGSISELREKMIGEVEKIESHRPYVDEIKIKCDKCNGEAKRIKDLIDVWFDSGSMPFASGEFPENYPADFISEAIDQTRGWFYTLLAISTLLGDGASYKNVICLGHVLDEKGKKMSKSRGNVIDPWTILDKYGADSARWVFYTVNAPGDAKRLGEKNFQESMRKFILILWNVYSFFVTYANLDGWQYKGGHWEPKQLLDRWIVSYFYELVQSVETKLENFDITGAAREIEKFNTDLSTWYLRRSRKRRDDGFYATMFKILIHFSKVIAPFVPFVSEAIYQNLKTEGAESVHLCDWPKSGEVDKKLLDDMAKVRDLAEKGRVLRAEKGIRTRQPLKSFTIDIELDEDLQGILKDELNVLEILNGDKIELDTELTDELREEGTRRDVVRLIQDLRKDAGLSPSDEVTISYQAGDELHRVIKKYISAIQTDTKSKLTQGKKEAKFKSEGKIEDQDIWLGLE